MGLNNAYQYTKNNPTNYIDPDGKIPVLLILKWTTITTITYYAGKCFYAMWNATDAICRYQGLTESACTNVDKFLNAKEGKALMEHCPKFIAEWYKAVSNLACQ
jgi:hypothetical protein